MLMLWTLPPQMVEILLFLPAPRAAIVLQEPGMFQGAGSPQTASLDHDKVALLLVGPALMQFPVEVNVQVMAAVQCGAPVGRCSR